MDEKGVGEVVGVVLHLRYRCGNFLRFKKVGNFFGREQIAGFDVKIGGLNNQEIDFVAEKNGERIYVQATLTINEEKTLEREFGNLLKIGDNYPKYVVTLDEFDGNTFEGVRCLSLRGFIGEILGTPLSHL